MVQRVNPRINRPTRTTATPRASFLLPAWNAARTLRRAVRCLLDQSIADHEVVISDDASTDDTMAVASALAAEDDRVRVVTGPHGGIGVALNRALAAARADVVVRMDADDTCPPERLALLLDALAAHPDAGVVGSRVEMVPPERVGAGMRRYLSWQNGLLGHDGMARERFVESPITHATCAFRRFVLDTAGGWATGVLPEDIDLWLRLFRAGVRFAKRPEVLYHWHEHDDRATRRDPHFAADTIQSCKAAHLVRTLPGRRLAVWGTGQALGSWERALAEAGASLRAGGVLDPKALRRGASLPWGPAPSVTRVLPFLSVRVRGELRQRLDDTGERELESYVFVA